MLRGWLLLCLHLQLVVAGGVLAEQAGRCRGRVVVVELMPGRIVLVHHRVEGAEDLRGLFIVGHYGADLSLDLAYVDVARVAFIHLEHALSHGRVGHVQVAWLGEVRL